VIRTYIVLFVGLCFEAFGMVFLRKGMQQIGEITSFTIPELLRVVGRGATNINVLTGVGLDALFFACLLIALSWTPVSIVLPLTAFGYVFTAVSAKFILHEDVNALRIAGTMLVVIGCIMVGKSGVH